MQLLCSSLQSAGKNGDFTLAAEFVDRLETEFEIVKQTLLDYAKSPQSHAAVS
jgi:hypothetical protein